MPELASLGYHAVGETVKTDLMGYLEKEAHSYKHIPTEDDESRKEIIEYVIHDEDVPQVAVKLQQTTHLFKAARAIQRSNLSALIAEFDFLIFRVIRSISKSFPGIFVTEKDNIPVSHFRAGGDFLEWQDKEIHRKIENQLRQSHKDTIMWLLSEVAGLKDKSQIDKHPFFKDFQEICQRRHLFIHNGGEVNAAYIAKCKEAGFSDEDLPKVGQELEISPKYLKRSAARVYLVGIFTVAITAQSLFPDYKDIVYRFLLSISHEFLTAGKTKMARRIVDFAEYNARDFDNDIKLKFGINRALSFLFDPDLSSDEQSSQAVHALTGYDWSVASPIFQLALSCVRRDFTNLDALAKAAYESGLSYRDAAYFAVFKEAREFDTFLTNFPKAQ